MSSIRSIFLLASALVYGASALAQAPGQVNTAPQGQPASQSAPVRSSSPPPMDSRENPFLTSTTSEEDRRLADRERMRSVVREMFPEMRSMMQPDIASLRQQITDDTKKQVSEALAKVPAPVPNSPNAPASPPQSGTAPKAAKLPEKAKFIGCVNGKALYRDGNQGYNFFWSGPEADVFGCSAP